MSSSARPASISSPPTACTSSAEPRIDGSVDRQVARLLAEGIASLRRHARFMHDAENLRDPEIVHEARVAVRRMRAALHVFPLEASAGEVRVRRAHKALKAVGRVLGEARDWDVIAAELLPARRALLDNELGPAGAARLRRKVLGARRQANAAARLFVADAHFEEALAHIDRLRVAIETSEAQPRRARTALHWIKRQQARVLRKAGRLPRLDAAARHALRIEGKRLRYAVELLESKGGKWVRALKRIQDALGKATDAHMLAERVTALDAAAGRILRADERECVGREIPRIAKLFKAWARAPAPG